MVLKELPNIVINITEKKNRCAVFLFLPFFSTKDGMFILLNCSSFHSNKGVCKINGEPSAYPFMIYNTDGELMTYQDGKYTPYIFEENDDLD